MYYKSKTLIASGIIVLAIIVFSFLKGGVDGPQADKGVAASMANFALAEKFSDAEIYKALYGSSTEEGSDETASTSHTKYIRFKTVIVEPNWIDGGNRFWYAFKANGTHQYYIVDAEKGTRDSLFDPQELSAKISRKTGESIDLAAEIPEGLTVIQGGDLIHFELNGKAIDIELPTGRVRVSKSKIMTEDFVAPTNEFSRSPDGNYVVYAMENNLYVRDKGGKVFQLTRDGEPWYGYSRQVGSYDSQKPLQQRMGWIGNTNKFYVERWDNRRVGELWFIDSLTEPRPTLRTTRFAMPGENNVPLQELWIFDAVARTGFRVDTDKWPGQFIGNMDIGSSPYLPAYKTSNDGKYLYFSRMSRGYRDIELLKLDVRSGKVDVLLAEQGEPYFTIRFPMFAPVKGGEEVLWLSDRSGRNHYYLYGNDGVVKSAITDGDYTVRRIAWLDEANRYMVAEVFGKDPKAYLFHSQYYKFPLDGGEPLQLTPEDATHRPYFSPDGKFFVDNYSRADQAPIAVLRNSDGELVMPLEQLDTKRLRGMGFKMQEYFAAKAADGKTDLYGVMWKPADFDPSRAYPVIATVQPNASMSGANFAEFRPGNVAVQLAQLGFVVLEFRTRGQGRHVRDKHYLLHSYGNERDYPLADAKAIVEQLTAQHDYLDINRVGAYGHSGGGFMSAALCMKYPSLFKVCVSASGNHDNRIAEQNSTEFHWGVRPVVSGKDITWITNLHPNQELASGLDSHLLLIHGDNDMDTNFAQSVRLANALIKANKRFDFMIMPSQDHDYNGAYNEYFDRLKWAYFSEHLLGDPRSFIDLKYPRAVSQP